MEDFKKKAIQGGFAKLCGQVANSVIRLGFIMILARLLDPKDFGLVTMVTAITGFFFMLGSAGILPAVVQKSNINKDQLSLLFWINLFISTIFCLICIILSPLLVSMYHEPRLFWLTVVMSTGFLFNGAGTLHNAILQRQLRYFALALIEGFSQLLGIAVGTVIAIGGGGYWALVGSTLASQIGTTVCVWLAAAWIPQKPQGSTGVGPLLQFGGVTTLNCLVIYLAYNFEKILLGRFWGADALGIYGRAYQLVVIPTDTLNAAVGGVAFSALSRLQDDPVRLRNYFLNGYSLVASMTIPLSMFGLIFADDIIEIVLGPKWIEAAYIFRLLTPTVLIFGIINPLGWLLWSVGLQGRSLRIAIVIAPLVIGAYVIGLPFGPSGVALAYSTAMTLWLIPHVFWCLHNTIVYPGDLARSVSRPFLSGFAAALCVLAFENYWREIPSAILRLGLGGLIMLLSYIIMLFFVFGQRTFYTDLLRELTGNSPREAETRLAETAP